MGSRRVFQAQPLVQSVVGASGITSAQKQMSTAEQDQLIFIAGSGGAVTVVSAPEIEAHTVVGAKITLVGTSDTNTVTFNNSATLALNGPITLGLDDVLELMWTGVRYVELGRNI